MAWAIVVLPTFDGVMEDDRFLSLDEEQGGEIADLRAATCGCRRRSTPQWSTWSRRGFAYAPRDAGSIAPGEPALTKRLQEPDVAELYRGDLGQPGLDGGNIPSSLWRAGAPSSSWGLVIRPLKLPKQGNRVTANTCAGRDGSLGVDITQSLSNDSLIHTAEPKLTPLYLLPDCSTKHYVNRSKHG